MLIFRKTVFVTTWFSYIQQLLHGITSFMLNGMLIHDLKYPHKIFHVILFPMVILKEPPRLGLHCFLWYRFLEYSIILFYRHSNCIYIQSMETWYQIIWRKTTISLVSIYYKEIYIFSLKTISMCIFFFSKMKHRLLLT